MMKAVYALFCLATLWFCLATLCFVTWTTTSGVLSFTDNPNRVPAKYRPVATEREWSDVRARISCANADSGRGVNCGATPKRQ